MVYGARIKDIEFPPQLHLFMCGNGGTVVSELAVGGLMLPGQLKADKRTLLEFASNFNIPEPVVDNMMKQYRSNLEQAYQSGQKLALMNN